MMTRCSGIRGERRSLAVLRCELCMTYQVIQPVLSPHADFTLRDDGILSE